jgi:hypothetical protein
MNKRELQKITKTFTDEEIIIYNVLKEGYENRVSKGFIEGVTGIKERKFKEILKSLRFKGIPICSQIQNGGGYWIEWNKKEFGKFVYSQKIELEGYKKSLTKLIEIYKSLRGKDSNELFV